MINDSASGESRSEQDHSVAETQGQARQRSEGRITKVIRTVSRAWRALAFLIIVLVTGSYAFHYKALSDPGSESEQLSNHPPQEIEVFVSDPSVSIDVDAVIMPKANVPLPPRSGVLQSPSTPQVDQLTLAVHMPNLENVTFLILVKNWLPGSASDFGSDFSRLSTPPLKHVMTFSPAEQQVVEGFYAAEIPITSISPKTLIVGTTLDLPIGSDLQQTNAFLYGHLPAVGSVDQWVNSFSVPPLILAEDYKNSPDRIRDIVLGPKFNGPNSEAVMGNPKSYRTPYGGPGELFWTPAGLSVTETQTNLVSTIANQQIDYMTPAGQTSGPDYTWHGSTYLEPVFQATNNGVLQGESNSAFLSGILFGVAGAAAIAFVQEVPENISQRKWWSRRRRKRRPPSRNASNSQIGKEGREPTGLGWPSLLATITQ